MSDTGRPADPNQPGARPAWGQTGSTPPTGPSPVTPPPATNWQVAQSTPPAGPPPATPPTATPPAGAKGRPGWLIPAIVVVVVLVVVAIIIGIVVSSKGSDDTTAPPVAASTVLLPSPTPTVAPIARTATTAFATALPTSVLQYALATSADNPTWTAAGAIEAYSETYTDGGTGTVTVNAGQWETPAEATAFAGTLTAALPSAPAPNPTASGAPGAPTLPQSGDVTAAGATVGTYTIADNGNGTGTAVWTNGTTVFQATAPVADVVDLYSAYPL